MIEWRTIEEKRHDQYSYFLIQENEATGGRRTVYVDGNEAFLFNEAKGEIIDILAFCPPSSRRPRERKDD